jgi:hypothetical protein
MDQNPDSGSAKTYESEGSGFGSRSATLMVRYVSSKVADPHPAPYQCDGNLRPLIHRTSKAPFSASRPPL